MTYYAKGNSEQDPIKKLTGQAAKKGGRMTRITEVVLKTGKPVDAPYNKPLKRLEGEAFKRGGRTKREHHSMGDIVGGIRNTASDVMNSGPGRSLSRMARSAYETAKPGLRGAARGVGGVMGGVAGGLPGVAAGVGAADRLANQYLKKGGRPKREKHSIGDVVGGVGRGIYNAGRNIAHPFIDMGKRLISDPDAPSEMDKIIDAQQRRGTEQANKMREDWNRIQSMPAQGSSQSLKRGGRASTRAGDPAYKSPMKRGAIEAPNRSKNYTIEKDWKRKAGSETHGTMERDPALRALRATRRGIEDALPHAETKREMRAKGGKWIQQALNPEHKGKLKRTLGVPMDKKIPARKLERAEHSRNPTIRKEARLAETLRSFHRPRGK